MHDQWNEWFGPSEEYEAMAERHRAYMDIENRLCEAITRGDVDQVEAIFAEHPHIVHNVWCFLHAIEESDAGIVSLFLAKGADPNAIDESYRTPLSVASRVGYDLIVKMLVEAGADPNLLPEDIEPEVEESCRGESPLLYAALWGDEELVRYLWPRTRPDVREKARAALRARLQLLEGSPGPAKSDLPTPPTLCKAIEAGDTESALALLKAGADPLQSNDEGETPLTLAARQGNLAVVRALLAAGVAGDQGKASLPLYDAVLGGNREVVRELLAAGADVNSRGRDGSTALMRAAASGDLDMVHLLVEWGADVNVTNSFGQTALSLALVRGHQTVSDFLYPLSSPGLHEKAEQELAREREYQQRDKNEDEIPF